MLFTSPVFLFHFLPLFFIVYGAALLIRYAVRKIPAAQYAFPAPGERQGLHRRLHAALHAAGSFWPGNLVVLLFSLVFYFWGETTHILLLLSIILCDYAFGLFLAPGATKLNGRKRKILFIACITINIASIFVFKYAAFAVNSITHLLGIDATIGHIALPLGISFFVFQAMSYVIDVYRGVVAPNKSLMEFACYITMFPQLVAGPIVRYVDIANQLENRGTSLDNLAAGVERFAFGLAKKILVANQVAQFADVVFAMRPEQVTPSQAWLGTICYAIQIYFDFSGYSDMAIGIGKMIGFEFRENFRHPYAAISMQDFWRRWHISLSTWFRDYLYIPLGGNKKGKGRTYFNLIVVFLLCGLWHGAALNFILWGGYHGTFLILERAAKLDFTKHRLLGRVYTLLAVLFGWLLFRAESFEQITALAARMCCIDTASIAGGSEYAWYWFTLDAKLALVAGIVLSFPLFDRIQAWANNQSERADMAAAHRSCFAWETARIILVAALLAGCLPLIISDSYNPFIYFRF